LACREKPSSFGLHSPVHYAASACDDLFAFGVMAWRLVTDAYPPPIPPEASGSEASRGGRLELRSLLELNPRVSPALGAIILRLLDLDPGERFHGRAREVAAALEQAAEGAGAEADRPLFR
jgi:hypothetical protein